MPDRQAAAMLDCEDGDSEANSNCKHCQASGDNQQRYWDIQLDQDLLETICSIYPEWFKDCNMNISPENNNNTSAELKTKQEETNQKTIDKNKESLKVKLMLRRPFNQLVDQGILPSLKSSPSFHESRQKLERSKMGDILKHKIQKRPERQELIQQHILEDSCIDNSLQDRQRQMKRARLADDLSERLGQRPGPLELVKVNFLHADEILAQAVREGGLTFRSACDTPSPQQLHLGPDEDSGSDGTFSPSPPYDCNEHSQGSLPSLDANESSPMNPNQISPCSAGAFSMSPPSSVSSPLSVLTSVVSPQSEQIFDYMVHMQQQQQHSSKETIPGNKNNRKKTKPKTQPKARTIKFHEYKGPPNAQKNSPMPSSTTTEPSYDLLLQQQQLQLQWQLEWLQKNPQAVLHTPQKRCGDQIAQVSQKIITNSAPTQQQMTFDAPPSPQKLLSKLEDMKVSDLKSELKKRNLPVSGSKPTLIERLKSYSELPQATSSSSSPNNSSSQQLNVNQFLDNLSTIPTDVTNISGSIASVEGGMDTIKCLLNAMSPSSRPPSAISLDLEPANGLDICDDVSDSSSTSFTNEDIVHLQQKFIEKLQRELERSQQQLQQSKQSILSQPAVSVASSASAVNTKNTLYSTFSDSASTTSAASASTNNGDNSEMAQSSESKSIQRQLIHQYLQHKIQHQQLQQRLMHEVQQKQATISAHSSSESSSTNANSTLTALLERQPMNASPVNLEFVTEAVTNFASSVTDRDSNRTNDIEVTGYTVIPIECSNGRSSVKTEDDDYPGVLPIEDVTENGDLESQFDVVSPLMVNNANGQSDSEPGVISVSNVISSRSSSLPSFSALVSCTPPPTRNNTDPQFVITKPPPDYNEATRQLNKVKQQIPSDDCNPRQSKIRKSSLKSQAVDDVLEILIKNGELPPSAAQDPPTPVTSIPKTEQSSIPIFTTNNDVFFSKPMTTTSLMSTTMAQSSVGKDISCNSPDLHMSLQSVLELTPPSSAGFGDTGSAPTSSLDFDFSLDMSEIEGMDLDNLDNPPHSTSTSDSSLRGQAVKDTKPCMEFLPDTSVNSSNHIIRTTDMSSINDRGAERNMDMDLIQWLEVLEESSATSSASNFYHSSSYGITNDHDPLFSTNDHETLDLFANDDIDFKPQHDLNFLPWGDKTDFTT